MKNTSSELTASQRYWLVHIKACEASGLTIRAYAEMQGLRVSSLYNARHRLKAIGAWGRASEDDARVESSAPVAPSVRFQRVVVKSEPESDEVTSPPATSLSNPVRAPCRIHLPNGVLLEVMTGTDACALAAVVHAAGAWP